MSILTEIQQSTPRQKLLWVCIALVFIGLTIGTFVLLRPNKKVTIGGLDGVNAPADRKEALMGTLYNVLNENLPGKNLKVGDAVIRDKSYIDNYDSLTDLHHASFIVDIESIKQSYIAYYEWSDNAENPNLSGYPVTIDCLPKNLLKYGDFGCMPFGTSTDTPAADVITRYLPYHVESKFEITSAATEDSGKTKLTVEAYMPGGMAEMPPELLAQYSAEINAWIKSKELDETKYSLDFVY